MGNGDLLPRASSGPPGRLPVMRKVLVTAAEEAHVRVEAARRRRVIPRLAA